MIHNIHIRLFYYFKQCCICIKNNKRLLFWYLFLFAFGVIISALIYKDFSCEDSSGLFLSCIIQGEYSYIKCFFRFLFICLLGSIISILSCVLKCFKFFRCLYPIFLGLICYKIILIEILCSTLLGILSVCIFILPAFSILLFSFLMNSIYVNPYLNCYKSAIVGCNFKNILLFHAKFLLLICPSLLFLIVLLPFILSLFF